MTEPMKSAASAESEGPMAQDQTTPASSRQGRRRREKSDQTAGAEAIERLAKAALALALSEPEHVADAKDEGAVNGAPAAPFAAPDIAQDLLAALPAGSPITPVSQREPPAAPTMAARVFAQDAAVQRAGAATANPSAFARVKSALSQPAGLIAAGACAGLIIGGAFAFDLGENADRHSSAVTMASLDSALPWKHDAALIGGRETPRQREEIHALRAEIETLRANADVHRQDLQKQAQDVRAVKSAMETAKSDAAAAKADVLARLDRDAGQQTELTGRIDKLERRLADPVATSSIAKPPAKAETLDAPKPAKPVQGYVLRDVSHGIALIETRRGMIEVAVGDIVPGAGRVESIARTAGKWRVVTTTGIIDDTVE